MERSNKRGARELKGQRDTDKETGAKMHLTSRQVLPVSDHRFVLARFGKSKKSFQIAKYVIVKSCGQMFCTQTAERII